MKKHIALYFCILSTSIFNQSLKITTVHDLCISHPEITYCKSHPIEEFNYKPFPLSRFPELQPQKGLLAETFILTIPKGQVCSEFGWIALDNHIIQDFIPTCHPLGYSLLYLKKHSFSNVKKIKGRVAVITSKLDIYYSHWMYNILGRLALLELNNIEYDWLYVASDKPYMKQTLALWGIDTSKLLDPLKENTFIEADELIVPSHVGVRMPQAHEYVLNWIPLELYGPKWGLDPKTIDLIPNTKLPNEIIPTNVLIENYFLTWTPLCAIYFSPWLIKYLRNIFLSHIENKKYNYLSKKIFISRKDTKDRNMINEDDVFALFEEKGFTRYNLTTLSLPEQIYLFNNAQIIAAAHGTGLTNLLFCKPNTQVIEIFQAKSDCSLYYLSQLLRLNHYCIQTMDFNNNIEGNISTTVPLFIIKDFIKNHTELFND